MRSYPGPIWDVGANIGKFSSLLAEANRDQKIYAFETNLTEIGWLAYNTRRYANIEIVPLALTRSGESLAAAFDPDFLKVPSPSGPRVLSMSLDEALRKLGRPAFIKIDIEGFELAALRGARKTISAGRGKLALFVEMHPAIWENIGVSRSEVLVELDRQGLGAEPLVDGGGDPWAAGVCLRLIYK